MSDKEELIKHLQEVHGKLPADTRQVIAMLSHPMVAPLMRRYLISLDANFKCARFESPWSCSMEANARYENIKFGWAGGASGIGLDESWCGNCRRRVLEE